MNVTVEKVIQNLRKNRIAVEYVNTKEEVLPLVKALLPMGCTVANGGSQSLIETGVMDLVKNGDYRYLDRMDPTLTPHERQAVTLAGGQADVYLCSSNAVTEDGELYNVDGNCNRISAIAFGPKQVIMVVGINKIVPDLNAAITRVKTIAAPLNTKRLNCDTYCNKTGVCMGLKGKMTDGCASPARICCNYLVSGQQRVPERIRVILVGESLGF